MPTKIVILCDERDAEVAASIRTSLEGRGASPTFATCDASADRLDRAAREALEGASSIIVVVREGGRGNRLLRAVEDEAPKVAPRASVVSLLADASLGGVVSARTAARIETLAESLAAASPSGGARSPAREPSKRWPFVAAAVALLLLLTSLFALRSWLWPPAPSEDPPVALTGTLSNTGWIVTFHLREEAASLDYKRPTDLDYISTGQVPAGVGQRRTLPHAQTTVGVPDLHGRVPFSVRYTTLDGAERGPFEVIFDTQAAAVASMRYLLGLTPEWVALRLFDDRYLCYFTTLLTYKYALREIHYGFDNEPLTRRVRFTPSDMPGIDDADELFVQLPARASSVTVELVLLDGTTEGPRRFVIPR